MSRDAISLTRRSILGAAAGLGVGLLGAAIPVAWARALQEGGAGELATRIIPSTGERLPVVGIGTARRFDVGASELQRQPLREVLDAFVRMGGRLVDTAPSYGEAERVIGDLVHELGIRERLFLATKVDAGRDGREASIAQMNASLERLRVEHLDLLQVHNLAGVEAVLPLVQEWKDSGRARHIGVSTSFKNQYDDLERVMQRAPLDVIQVDYAIDNRDAEQRILPLAQERGMAVMVNLPFGRGRVFQAFGDRPLPDWVRAWDIDSWAQFALKFVVSHPAVTCAIPGTATTRYLRDNLGAARGSMPDAATRARMAALIEAG